MRLFYYFPFRRSFKDRVNEGADEIWKARRLSQKVSRSPSHCTSHPPSAGNTAPQSGMTEIVSSVFASCDDNPPQVVQEANGMLENHMEGPPPWFRCCLVRAAAQHRCAAPPKHRVHPQRVAARHVFFSLSAALLLQAAAKTPTTAAAELIMTR